MASGRNDVTVFARLGGVLLIIFGTLLALFTAVVFLTGRPEGLEPEGFTGPVVPDNATALLVVIVFIVGLLEIAAGIFVVLGKEWARGLGVTLAVVFGLLSLAALVPGLGSGMGFGLGFLPALVALAHLYIAGALIFAWRRSAVPK